MTFERFVASFADRRSHGTRSDETDDARLAQDVVQRSWCGRRRRSSRIANSTQPRRTSNEIVLNGCLSSAPRQRSIPAAAPTLEGAAEGLRGSGCPADGGAGARSLRRIAMLPRRNEMIVVASVLQLFGRRDHRPARCRGGQPSTPTARERQRRSAPRCPPARPPDPPGPSRLADDGGVDMTTDGARSAIRCSRFPTWHRIPSDLRRSEAAGAAVPAAAGPADGGRSGGGCRGGGRAFGTAVARPWTPGTRARPSRPVAGTTETADPDEVPAGVASGRHSRGGAVRGRGVRRGCRAAPALADASASHPLAVRLRMGTAGPSTSARSIRRTMNGLPGWERAGRRDAPRVAGGAGILLKVDVNGAAGQKSSQWPGTSQRRSSPTTGGTEGPAGLQVAAGRHREGHPGGDHSGAARVDGADLRERRQPVRRQPDPELRWPPRSVPSTTSGRPGCATLLRPAPAVPRRCGAGPSCPFPPRRSWCCWKRARRCGWTLSDRRWAGTHCGGSRSELAIGPIPDTSWIGR